MYVLYNDTRLRWK